MTLNLSEGREPVPGYVLVRALGRGGFGEVWEALAPGGVRVALKFVRMGTSEGGAEQRALGVIRDIRHPHLLDVQFAARVDDCMVIAMPLCERSLMDRLEECRAEGLPGVPRDELLGYMRELALAVDFLNERRHQVGDGTHVGVQHRDIKPHNIFLVGGSVRLADFGLAKVVEATLASHTGSMSPHYVAPEVIKGEVSRWSDQYSLAISYAQLRTGRLPITGESVNQVLYAHVHLPPDLSALLEPEERAAVARALAKRPEERWPSCRAFVQALAEPAQPPLPETLTDTVIPADEPETASGRRLARLRRAALAALAATLAGVLALVVMSRPGPARPVLKAAPAVAAADREPAPERPPAATPAARNSPGPSTPRTVTVGSDPALAVQARGFLKTYCYDCHGGANDVGEELNVLDLDVLVRVPEEKAKQPYVVPGKPGESLVWEYAGVGPKYRMPKKNAPQPTPEERQVLERWIAAGAEFPRAVERHAVAGKAVAAAIHDHLTHLSPADRPFQRYITLDHLNNDPTVADDTLRLHRAAVAKLVNSLSWQTEIVLPAAIDGPAAVVLNVDLRKLGWEPDDWEAIARLYPYGVRHPDDRPWHDLESEVATLAGSRLAALRADWFVATVARHPLYDQLLRLPRSLRELEAKLNVHFEANFDRDVLRRGGLISSGVSRHNRLVERHPTPYGAYWRSYDFASSAGRANLLLFPLGPRFTGNRFDDQAFEQAGGEVIFHLPNGLQGYMLASARDDRLDTPAPVAIVRDHEETSGTPEVVNGLSCLACHKDGMKPFQDETRAFPAVFGDAKDKMERLYAPADEMNRLLARDAERFLAALDRAIGPFVRAGDEPGKNVRDLVEPIGEVARLYNKDLARDAVAAELGFADIDAVRNALGAAKFQELGLGPLLDAHAVKRELWEAQGRSLFHRVANALGLPRVEVL
jgi:serine/threonine-protein kinase